MALLPAFVSITVLFFVFLVAKKSLEKSFLKNKRFCAICAAVSLTWIALLIPYWSGLFRDGILVALLLGQTILGVFYLVEKKVPEKLLVFRLPFLLTLIALGYSLLVPVGGSVWIVLFIAILWTVFILFYASKKNKVMGSFVKRMVKCCKEW